MQGETYKQDDEVVYIKSHLPPNKRSISKPLCSLFSILGVTFVFKDPVK